MIKVLTSEVQIIKIVKKQSISGKAVTIKMLHTRKASIKVP